MTPDWTSVDWLTAPALRDSDGFRAWSLAKYRYDPWAGLGYEPYASYQNPDNIPSPSDYPEISADTRFSLLLRLSWLHAAEKGLIVLDENSKPLPFETTGWRSMTGAGPFRPCECPCPGHECSGDIHVADLQGSWTETTVMDYWQFFGDPPSWQETSSTSETVATNLNSEPDEARRMPGTVVTEDPYDEEIWQPCQPIITVSAPPVMVGGSLKSGPTLSIGGGWAMYGGGIPPLLIVTAPPLTDAVAYPVEGSTSGDYDYWERNTGPGGSYEFVEGGAPTLLDASFVTTWRHVQVTYSGSFSLRYAVHQEYL